MRYFATLNEMHGSVRESIFRAVKHYDLSAMLVLFMVLAMFIVIAACRISDSKKLKEIERKKIYDRWDEES